MNAKDMEAATTPSPSEQRQRMRSSSLMLTTMMPSSSRTSLHSTSRHTARYSIGRTSSSRAETYQSHLFHLTHGESAKELEEDSFAYSLLELREWATRNSLMSSLDGSGRGDYHDEAPRLPPTRLSAAEALPDLDWDNSNHRSLFTMDDETIYTTPSFAASKQQHKVTIEGGPAAPAEQMMYQYQREEEEEEEEEEAPAFHSGMDKEEIMSMVSALTQDTLNKMHAAALVKKARAKARAKGRANKNHQDSNREIAMAGNCDDSDAAMVSKVLLPPWSSSEADDSMNSFNPALCKQWSSSSSGTINKKPRVPALLEQQKQQQQSKRRRSTVKTSNYRHQQLLASSRRWSSVETIERMTADPEEAVNESYELGKSRKFTSSSDQECPTNGSNSLSRDRVEDFVESTKPLPKKWYCWLLLSTYACPGTTAGRGGDKKKKGTTNKRGSLPTKSTMTSTSILSTTDQSDESATSPANKSTSTTSIDDTTDPSEEVNSDAFDIRSNCISV